MSDMEGPARGGSAFWLAALLLAAAGGWMGWRWHTRPREFVHRSTCFSNLHQIAVALKLYKMDTGHYPLDTLECGSTDWWGTQNAAGVPKGDGAGLGALFPDYLPRQRLFNCPDSDWAPNDPSNPDFMSYDGRDPGKLCPDNVPYRRIWKAAGGRPDPAERRQLIWPNAPADTVVTWCRWHRRNPSFAGKKDTDHVVYLDGHSMVVPAKRTGHGP